MRAVFALSDLQRDGALLTVALGVTALATPVAMRVALRVGLVDRPAPHKFHREPTPYLGGLAIALSVLASLAFAMVAEPRVRSELMAVAFGATALAAIGLVDDWATISPFPRGTDHWSHRLVALGASPRLAALASYAAAAVAGAGGLWLIRVHSLALTWAVAAAGVVVAVLLLAFMETVDATGRRASFVPSSVLVSALSALEVPPMLEPVPTPIRSQAGPA